MAVCIAFHLCFYSNIYKVQGALEWLEKNQDKPLEEVQEEAASSSSVPSLTEPVAASLICNECQRKFRSQVAAEAHAEKTGHTDFAESTEEIAPLTEEEKKSKLAELLEKSQEKKAALAAQDKVEQKRNEVCLQLQISLRLCHPARGSLKHLLAFQRWSANPFS